MSRLPLIALITFGCMSFALPVTAQETARQAETEREASFKMSDVVLRVATALQEGKITTSQAAEYIISAQQKLDAEESYTAYQDEISAAVRAGDLTREEAGKELGTFKTELHEQMVTSFKERMDLAVASGAMSSEQVKELWGVYKSKCEAEGSKTITRQDYADAQAKMQKMVDAGEITKQQMDEKLVEMRKMIGKRDAQPQVTREDYAKAQADMQKMVDAGKITEDQMNARLNRMKKMMGKESARSNRQDYADAQAKMQKMVEAGEITEDQMNQRLNRMKDKMQRDAEERSDSSNDCMELRSELGKAVRNGDITREEAGEKWKAAGCGQ